MDPLHLIALTAQIIDGIHVAKYVKSRIMKKIYCLKTVNMEPCLATVLVGDNLASATYVKNKQRAAVELGMKTKDLRLPSNCTQSELIELIKSLNEDVTVHGILSGASASCSSGHIYHHEHYQTLEGC